MNHQLTEKQWKRISADYATMYTALRRIASYMPAEKLRKRSMKLYGLEPDEAIDAAYENMLYEAQGGLRHINKPMEQMNEATEADQQSI